MAPEPKPDDIDPVETQEWLESIDSVLRVEGSAVTAPQAPGGVEVHGPTVEVVTPATTPPPFDLFRPTLAAQLPTILDYALTYLSAYTTRHYVIPPALGVDIRYLNGYMYLSPVPVSDPDEIASRVPEFAERAGYYFANWSSLYDAWMVKIKGVIQELEALEFKPLPEREDMAVLTEGRGIGSGQLMLIEYDKLVQWSIKHSDMVVHKAKF